LKGVGYEYIGVIFCIVKSVGCVTGEEIQAFEKNEENIRKTQEKNMKFGKNYLPARNNTLDA